MLRLGLNHNEAITFARFLVEERDEDNEEEEQKVRYNPKQRINQQLVCIRLQSYSTYPIIYKEHHEQEAFSRIKNVLEGKHDFVKSQFNEVGRLYTVEELYNVIRTFADKSKVSDMNIDCAFVALCRSIPFK